MPLRFTFVVNNAKTKVGISCFSTSLKNTLQINLHHFFVSTILYLLDRATVAVTALPMPTQHPLPGALWDYVTLATQSVYTHYNVLLT